MKKCCEKKIKNFAKKNVNFSLKNKYFCEKKWSFLWRIFPLKIGIGICIGICKGICICIGIGICMCIGIVICICIGIGICICIGIGIFICTFCKEYLPLQNPKKKTYLRLKIITQWIAELLSDKGSHRNSVPLFKNPQLRVFQT